MPVKQLRFIEVYVPTSRLPALRKQQTAVISTFGGISEYRIQGAFKHTDGTVQGEAITVWRIGYDVSRFQSQIVGLIQRLVVRPLHNLGEASVLVVDHSGNGRLYERS